MPITRLLPVPWVLRADGPPSGGEKTELFETAHRRGSTQPRLFELAALDETGWLKALRLEEYAARNPRRSDALQQTLFPYLEDL